MKKVETGAGALYEKVIDLEKVRAAHKPLAEKQTVRATPCNPAPEAY